MSSDVVIQVENLGKKYRIRHEISHPRYTALRDVLSERAKGLFSALQRFSVSAFKTAPSPSLFPSSTQEDFWALKDVSFDVKQGDVLGLIGRNGAGKSTLLKILSRITEPTEGQVRIRGRVASLLEVGTGFHPELTGRENIYLNGAILGMTRAEIKKKFDEIVAFAEVEKFLDTPVKRYSSGMYVRLAFAVAAHLEPEILIVDEVLAVGDAEFQKKCLGKMGEVARGGRTVLFVSHSMDTVLRLCSGAVLLNQGRVAAKGPTRAIISSYLHGPLASSALRSWNDPNRRPGNGVVRLVQVEVHDQHKAVRDTLDVRFPIGITVTYDVFESSAPLVDDLNVFTDQGLFLFVAHNVADPLYNRPRPVGRYKSTAWIPGNLLAEGGYTVSIGVITLSPFTFHAREDHAVSFRITDPALGGSARGAHTAEFPGAFRPLLDWVVSKAD